MTKLEAGAISAKTEVHDVGEIVDASLKRAKKILSKHKVLATLPSTPLKVKADPVLLEQVLFNVLDNAAKYAPEETTISMGAWQDVGRVILQIGDEGPGIPPDDVEKIFDKFYRANKADHVRAGTGLGLPISRGFIEIMGGTITAANRFDRSGALLTITLPTPTQSEALENAA
jgi:two-component system, OmpR family, sensor histidine kinase KdpD